MLFKTLFGQELDFTPFYSYSDNPILKRQQIWENLKQGLLLEDTGRFIYWKTPFYRLHQFQERRRDSGDKTEWFFGKHNILDGYEAHLEAMKWVFKSDSNPIAEIYSRFGIDFEGRKTFNLLREHLTQLLGNPTRVELEEWGSFDLGTITWENENVHVYLNAVEIFNVRYKLGIGFKSNPNDESSVGILFRLYIWFCMKFNIDVKI